MKSSKSKDPAEFYDVVVVGGGPAGMMAAATAALEGARVLLLEKNPLLGKKLLITGGGRCNVTNNKPVVRQMLSQYKDASKFLFSTFSQHGVAESIEWFAGQQVLLKEGNEGRLFPETQKAQTIKAALVRALQQNGVTLQLHSTVKSLEFTQGVAQITLDSGILVSSKTCILATGGLARPETGSTGDGFTWLRQLGHQVVDSNLALVPITLREKWTKKLSGVSLSLCKVTILADGIKHSAIEGKVLFTHVGLSGPAILNISKTIGELLSYGSVGLQIDLFPGFDSAKMNELIQKNMHDNANKKVHNALAQLLPTALAKEVIVQCGIDGEIKCNSLTRQNRIKIIDYVKAIPLTVSGLLGKDKAVVSAGGVALTEVDFKTMQSKLVPGLYIVGDVLNVNRPSGGYSLQLCWSTGAVAGKHAATASKLLQ